MAKRRSIGSVIAVALAVVLSVFCLVACGNNLDGTYKFDEARSVKYGDMVLEMNFKWELYVKGDNYVMTSKTNANGMVIYYDFSGKCSVEENKITCLKPTAANQYSGIVAEDGSITVDPDNSAAVKLEGEALTKTINSALSTAFFDADKTSVWVVDKSAKTAIPNGYVV